MHMKKEPRIGTHFFHEEPNMNYQFNRIYSINGGDLEEIKEVSAGIKTLDDWINEFMRLAKKAEAGKRALQASAYYRAANFYISPGDPNKNATYASYKALINELYGHDFTSGIIREIKVPYEGGFIPVWHSKPAKKDGETNIVVAHLGYDSLKEELIPMVHFFRNAGLELYIFEGPGQGDALYSGKLPMTHEWEKPVKAVLDYFSLDNVTLIGLSLGGYLAPRAGAFEHRVKRIIAWGVMYDFFDVVVSRRGKLLEIMLKLLLPLKASFIVNAISRIKMRKDTYAKWGIEHGMSVLGAKSPYEYFKKLKLYSMKNISHLVRQDFLLIGSTHDHFIPAGDFFIQARKLVNVRSFTGRIFTKHEHGENHVSFGNIPLVLQYMTRWIREHSEIK